MDSPGLAFFWRGESGSQFHTRPAFLSWCFVSCSRNSSGALLRAGCCYKHMLLLLCRKDERHGCSFDTAPALLFKFFKFWRRWLKFSVIHPTQTCISWTLDVTGLKQQWKQATKTLLTLSYKPTFLCNTDSHFRSEDKRWQPGNSTTAPTGNPDLWKKSSSHLCSAQVGFVDFIPSWEKAFSLPARGGLKLNAYS